MPEVCELSRACLSTEPAFCKPTLPNEAENAGRDAALTPDTVEVFKLVFDSGCSAVFLSLMRREFFARLSVPLRPQG